MRIFPSQERQFLDPSSPSVNYNPKPFHVGTLCLSKWFDLTNNCKFIKKRRWYQSVSLFYYKVQQVFQCATIRISDVNNELITRPRCPSFSFQVFQGDWKNVQWEFTFSHLQLWEFRNRQKLVLYISHMHFMISKQVHQGVFLHFLLLYKAMKKFCHLSVKDAIKPLLHNRRRQSFQTSLRRVSDWKEAAWTTTYCIFWLVCLFYFSYIVSLLTVGLC